MKQGYFVTDDGLCAVQGLKSLSEAKREAEAMINETPFGELGRFEIGLRGDGVTKLYFRWEAIVDWEKV